MATEFYPSPYFKVVPILFFSVVLGIPLYFAAQLAYESIKYGEWGGIIPVFILLLIFGFAFWFSRVLKLSYKLVLKDQFIEMYVRDKLRLLWQTEGPWRQIHNVNLNNVKSITYSAHASRSPSTAISTWSIVYKNHKTDQLINPFNKYEVVTIFRAIQRRHPDIKFNFNGNLTLGLKL